MDKDPLSIPASGSSSLAPPTTVPSISLTEEQHHAVTLISNWMKDPSKSEFRFGGFAGTGKTTVIKFLLDYLTKPEDPTDPLSSKGYRIEVSAFTGKAVNVLQRKKVFACTLHSLMYNVEILKNGGYEFHLKTSLEGNPDLIIVDEASMISTDLYRDLLSFGKKYLFVGDPGQLEPVGDNPNLMAHPDFVLSKIHRQAEESPIIQLATQVRTNGQIARGTFGKNGELVIMGKQIDSPLFLSCDQVIVAKNKTRKDFNNAIRKFKKLPVNQPIVGDKLICLRNNVNVGVFNGSILYIDKIIREYRQYSMEAILRDEAGKTLTATIWLEPFFRETAKEHPPKGMILCDFGYAITCHKSQGSEWDKVLVYDEYMSFAWDMRRWRYTAITRAAKELVYCL